MKLLIRPVVETDAADLARLVTDFSGQPVDAPTMLARLREVRSLDRLLLAVCDGEAAGFTSVRMLPDLCDGRPYAEVVELYVDPRWRRRGVGRALMASAEQYARGRGAGRLLVLTGLDNEPAQRFYREIGFATADVLALRKALRKSVDPDAGPPPA